MKKIYGIGNPLIDVIVSVSEKELDSLSLHKGTMQLTDKARHKELLAFIENREASYTCGGSCPNTVIALAAMGAPAVLGGMVGDDKYGEIYRKTLKELGVGDKLALSPEPTGSSVILLTPDRERTMNTYLGANREFSPGDVSAEAAMDADFFHFTGYMWDTESQQQSIRRAIEITRSHGGKISFDIADPFAVARYRETFFNLIRNDCDIVFANKEEARILFDNYDPYECCRSMGKLCETAIVKNGKKGSYIAHGGTIHTVPVSGPVTPTDTTGAGDVYAAGYLFGAANDAGVITSGRIASFLAGEIIQQVGAQFSSEKAAKLRKTVTSMLSS